MDYMTWCIIAGIGFWVLFALAIVAMLAWVYVYVQYYRWDKQDRERNTFVHAVQAAVQEAVEQAQRENTLQESDNDFDENNC